jgi:tetratricopeptide (TPR) repeat protein
MAGIAVAIQPNHASGNHYLGNCHYDRKEYNRATDYYRKAIAADPNDADPYYGMGQTYTETPVSVLFRRNWGSGLHWGHAQYLAV